MSTFEPRTVSDITDDHGTVSVYTNHDSNVASAVRLELDADSLHLDGPGARELGQALLDAAGALPIKDGWYVYTSDFDNGRYAIRLYRGEPVDRDGDEDIIPRAPLTYIGPLAAEDVAQIECQR